MKRPAFQFYPGDWQRDAALRACSVGARGLWIEMMCVMHQADPYGYLVLNGKPIGAGQLARMVGATEKEVTRWADELNVAGVYSEDSEGRFFSRRMVRDEGLRNRRAAGGILGGNPALVGSKVNGKVNHTPTIDLTPSSSVFSIQSSTSKTKTKAPGKRAISPDFGISEQVRSWATREGHDHLEKRLSHFVGTARAKGYTYSDWDQAFMNAVRDDWAKLSPAIPTYNFEHLED